MNGILIGFGSIGKRHLENLKHLGHTVDVVDIENLSELDYLLESNNYEFGFVCTPNDTHITYAQKLANKNIPFFCEKPLYSPLSDYKIGEIEQLIQTCSDSNIVNMAGCNLRFTKEVQELPSDAKYINVYFGYNLKKWRPSQNHLESYSANKKMGGGIFFDAIHEFDYLYYKFGKINSIDTKLFKFTDVTNDTEDLSLSNIQFESGVIASVHLNYLSENYTRYYEYVKDNTMHHVDFMISNKMYIDEVKYFLSCVGDNTQTFNTMGDAHYLIQKMKASYDG
jgi:predicted dehydrogenase